MAAGVRGLGSRSPWQRVVSEFSKGESGKSEGRWGRVWQRGEKEIPKEQLERPEFPRRMWCRKLRAQTASGGECLAGSSAEGQGGCKWGKTLHLVPEGSQVTWSISGGRGNGNQVPGCQEEDTCLRTSSGKGNESPRHLAKGPSKGLPVPCISKRQVLCRESFQRATRNTMNILSLPSCFLICHPSPLRCPTSHSLFNLPISSFRIQGRFGIIRVWHF